ncbi:ribonuclease HII [Candidatus Gracilibacteria bacterium]|nr:ribonuclease HII [Candidatus Gracilibacteria bacterium]
MFDVGIDEAGRGPWAGMVVASSFVLIDKKKFPRNLLEIITDSKKVTQKNREKIFFELIKLSSLGIVSFGVGVVDNYLIDEINIKQANKEAMRRSLVEIERKIGLKNIKKILIDGNDNYFFEGFVKPEFIIKGDQKIFEISCASIIAKVFRDKLIDTYALLYPEVGFEKHKGYGTKAHKDYLENSKKITGIHRISYKPIKNLI